ncbi:LOW QUALITY PROTEIN: glycosyltransferase [Bacillus sp. JCM 19046]|nr:LOW QUALITY PROTEIN: glycosyltransferase [Bacillus sp. JCM 19045]GAF17446.1 LOW QUALITY PROTEIN: glycosyltransferase [Bacillus sp. JCM 19046]
MKDIVAIIIVHERRDSIWHTLASLKQLEKHLQMIAIVHPPEYHLPRHHSNCITYRRHWYDVKSPASFKRFLRSSASFWRILVHNGYFFTINQTSGAVGNQYALFIPKATYLRYPFPDQDLLPFPEALLPFWFSLLPRDKKVCLAQSEQWARLANHSKQTSVRQKQEWTNNYALTSETSSELSITVLIANFNQHPYLDNAIASCLIGPSIPEQILVVDDGSTDDSVFKLNRWNVDKVQILFNPHNEGKARALNRLLPFVKSDYIIELDADDWLDPDAFSILANELVDMPMESPLLYGNLRRWKADNLSQVRYKGITKGRQIQTKQDLLGYRFPLGPRIYRTSALKEVGGFPISSYEEGRLYEDVAVLDRLLEVGPLLYKDFTIYNVRDHMESITQKNHSKWNGFLDQLDP